MSIFSCAGTLRHSNTPQRYTKKRMYPNYFALCTFGFHPFRSCLLFISLSFPYYSVFLLCLISPCFISIVSYRSACRDSIPYRLSFSQKFSPIPTQKKFPHHKTKGEAYPVGTLLLPQPKFFLPLYNYYPNTCRPLRFVYLPPKHLFLSYSSLLQGSIGAHRHRSIGTSHRSVQR